MPQSVREGALALGMSNFRATVGIVLPTARPAIITALLLAIARVIGETAPLLFTAFGTQFWEPIPAIRWPCSHCRSLLCDLSLRDLAAAGVGRFAAAGRRGLRAQLGARLMLRRSMKGLKA